VSCNRPLVTVIVPVYNAHGFLPQALQSIQAQNYPNLDVIIVDDGSTDGSLEVIRELFACSSFRFFQQANAGPSAARNLAIRQSSGELIAFLDADDQWPEGKLELQVGRLIEHPEVDVVTGRIRYVPMPGVCQLNIPFERDGDTATHVHLGSAVFRRGVFERVGLFSEDLRFGEDFEWFLRAREEGLRIVILESVTLLYRIHENNMTRGMDRSSYILPRVLKRSLDRRRQRYNGQALDLGTWSSFDESRAAASGMVSVVIPVHNCEQFIAQAIDSILVQTYRDIEVIVVDDGSDDGTAQALQHYMPQVRYLRQLRQGPGQARNVGVKLARGTYVAFLDADDIWMPEKLALQMNALNSSSRPDMVFSCIDEFVEPSCLETDGLQPRCRLAGYDSGTLLMRKDAFLRVGLFDPKWRAGEFIDWYARAQEAGLRGVLLPEVLMRRRIHGANMGLISRSFQIDYVRIIKALLDRRRKAALYSESKA
jgi:glycosyltransferase involved in cell wall biosynthesis